jgi:hypothetical protein
LKIYHPYGAIDKLPLAPEESGTLFGAGKQDLDSLDCIKLAVNIKTYTEEVQSEQITAIREEIA